MLRYLHWLLRIPRSRQRAVRVVFCRRLGKPSVQVCRLIFTLLYTRFVVIIGYGIFWLNRFALVICESGAFPSCVVNLLGRTLLIVYTVAGRRVFRPRRCPWTLRRTGKRNSAAILGQIGWNRYNWMKISLLGPVAFIRNCSRQYPTMLTLGSRLDSVEMSSSTYMMIFVVSSSPTARAPQTTDYTVYVSCSHP